MALLGRRRVGGAREQSGCRSVRSAIDRALAELAADDSIGTAVVGDDEQVVLDELLGVVHPGQLLASDAAAGAVDLAGADFALLPLGTMSLEGGAGARRRLVQVVHPGVRIAFPPLAISNARLHQVPCGDGPFIGRERTLGDLSHALATSRVVTVVGPPGIGKTRVAQEAAVRGQHRWPDGIWWVDLQTAGRVVGVADALLWAAEVNDTRGLSPLARGIEEFRSREALVVLDGCEDLADEAAHVSEALTASAPGVTALCTSRRRVETPQASVITLDVMTSAETTELVRVSAGPAAGEIAPHRWSRLDGRPLTARLVAARPDLFEPPPSVPATVSLEAALEMIHDELSGPAQATLRRLAVFVGAFAMDAAECVAGEGALSAVTELVSLGVAEVCDAGRYRLIPAVRQFALCLLDRAGERAAAVRAHLRHHLELASRAGREVAASASPWAFDAIDHAHHDLLAAIANGEAAGHDQDARRIATSLLPYWVLRGRYRDAVRVLERWPDDASVLAALGQARLFAMDLPHGFGINDSNAALAASASEGDEMARVRALTHIAFLETFMGSPAGPGRLEQAAVAGRTHEDPWSEIWATAGAFWAAGIARDAHDEAAPALDAVATLAVRFENRFLEAVVDLGRGLRDLRCAGDLSTALPLLHGALAACREVGEPIMEMFAACAVSEAEVLAGRWDDAEQVLATTLSRLSRSAVGRAEVVQVARARVADARGEASRARSTVEAALGAVRSVGAPDLVAGALLLLAPSRPAVLDEALVIARVARNRRLEAQALAMAGDRHAALALAWEGGFRPLTVEILEACACGDLLPRADVATVLQVVAQERASCGWVRPLRDSPATEKAARSRPSTGGETLSLGRAVAMVLRRLDGEPPTRLTRAEHAVAELVASGLSNAEVAAKLHISTATVKTHLVHVFAKLDVRNRAELAATWNWSTPD